MWNHYRSSALAILCSNYLMQNDRIAELSTRVKYGIYSISICTYRRPAENYYLHILIVNECTIFCRFIRSVSIVDSVSSRKFLEAAMNTDDAMLFYTVFKFFEQRNAKIRGNPKFQPGTFTHAILLTSILVIYMI